MLGLMSSVLGALIGIHHYSSASFIAFNKFINPPQAMTTAKMPFEVHRSTATPVRSPRAHGQKCGEKGGLSIIH
jgi:hypothetical protein